MAYTKVGPWTNGAAPYINATNLDHIEDGIADAHDLVTSLSANNIQVAYDAVGDGITDDTAAIQSALDTGKLVYLPATSAFYKTTSALTPVTGGGLIGDGKGTIIKLIGATTDSVLHGNGVNNFFLNNLTLDGDNTTKSTSTHCLRLDSCTGWVVPLLWADNAQSWAVGLYSSTDNKFGSLYAYNTDTSSAFMCNSGSDRNEVQAVYAKDCGGFGVQIFGSDDNKVGTIVAIDCGLEALGINYFSDRNHIDTVYSINSGDNGVSITGSYNQVGSIYVDTADYHGVCFYGEHNAVGTILTRNIGQAGALYGAVAFTPAFGGVAKNNVVGTLQCVDDQASPTTTYVIKGNADAHTAWTTGTAFSAGTFCKNGGNIYYTAAGGITGSTAPTHTSGTVSDGAVSWEYVQAVTDSAGNIVSQVRYTDNIATPVLGSDKGFFALGPDAIYHPLTWAQASSLNVKTTAWASSQNVQWGAWRSNNGRVYFCSNAGGTTVDAPTHSSGTVTGGTDGIAWTYMVDGNATPVVSVSNAGPIFYGRVILTSGDSNSVTRSLYIGLGTPEANVTADPGSLYIRTDASAGLELFVKAANTDATGWLPFHVRRYGATASRPSVSGSAFTGLHYFDTTLGKPIWYDGSGWVDATGATA